MSNKEFSLKRKHLRAENQKYPPDAVIEIPENNWPPVATAIKPLRVLRSRYFFIQEYEAENGIRLSVCRTELERDGDWRDGITWDELNQIKTMCGYADWYGVEVYPPASDIVNVANMRHLWLMPHHIGIGWRKGGNERR